MNTLQVRYLSLAGNGADIIVVPIRDRECYIICSSSTFFTDIHRIILPFQVKGVRADMPRPQARAKGKVTHPT
jgi:hypothetical protein